MQWMITESGSERSLTLARMCVALCAALSVVFSVDRCLCELISARCAQTMLGYVPHPLHLCLNGSCLPKDTVFMNFLYYSRIDGLLAGVLRFFPSKILETGFLLFLKEPPSKLSFLLR